ncbi:formylglycine-generating enzyme family protein [Enhygromyxa salina]|uniref:Serine/threonine-protein kinase pkn1 n=1 Tax=Enhygromyxa salina TaxID=215803 RepID=A0A2S9Y7X8_9BACT|nr:SUMF1/EgtB/PvdO family nonheme iron enzyme [Enhygromyxa salina]PRQ01228.1 Serine/threonine-protein kinase pkn1 [Enhygromyxa salina]
MICDLRLCTALLLSTALLCMACTGDDAPADEEDETGMDPGPDTDDEPLFIPLGTILIPGGEVWRGCLMDDKDCDANENPGGMINVSAFFIDEHEATVAEYRRCVDAGVCEETADDPDCNLSRSDRKDHPVNCLSWNHATSFCEWRGLRLPTEAEWERAARGDQLQLYPWGDDPPTCELARVDTCGNSTAPVGSVREGDSPFGIADMTGNVSEWVSDFYAADYYSESVGEDDPQGPASGSEHGVKGSAFTVPPGFPAQRISKRNSASPDSTVRIYGVRCARDR